MKLALLLLLALAALGGASSRAQDAPQTPAPAVASEASAPRLVAHVEDARLKELSGLAASRRFSGWVWAHNDSGDVARLFLLDGAGRTRAVVSLANAQAVDWEDIAVAGGAQDSTVTVADSGDNLHAREGIVLYRFRERDLPLQVLEGQDANAPDVPLLAPEVSIRADTLKLRYPEADGAQDAEALAANASGDLLLVTKSTGISRFYLALWPLGKAEGEQRLKLVAEKQFGSTEPGHRRVREMLVTAADLSPDERRLALITYATLYVWKLPPGPWDKLDWKAVLASPAEVKPLPRLDQCESVAWMGAGQVWVSSDGEHAPLWSVPVGEAK